MTRPAVFKATGNFPSMPSLYTDPAIKSFTKPFFNNAPIGQIYTQSVTAVRPQHLGPKEGDVRKAVTDGLDRVDSGKQTPDAAWQRVLSDVSKVS